MPVVADATTLAAARSALAHDDRELLRVIVERDVLSADARQWYEHEHVPDFEIWIARGATSAARFLGQVQRDGPRHGASARRERGGPHVGRAVSLVRSARKIGSPCH